MQILKFNTYIVFLTYFIVHARTMSLQTSGHRIRSKRQIETNFCQAILCNHGVCDPKAIMSTCKCNNGWTGLFCNERCRKKCGSHGKCSLFANMRERREFCKCDNGFSGEYCDKTVDAVNVLSQQESMSFRQISGVVYRQHTENNTVYDDKVCFPGFVCSHGICRKKHNNEGSLTVHCQCDQDWIGTFCHVRCSRKCKNGGRCYKERLDGNEFCICPFNYRGRFCEIRKTDSRAFRIVG